MKFIALLVFTLFAVNVSMAELTFAQDAPYQGIEWLGAVLSYVQSIPKVGPIISSILEVMGAIAAFGTAVVVFLQSAVAIPYFIMKFSGLKEKADKFKAVADKVINWAKWLSIHNVKK